MQMHMNPLFIYLFAVVYSEKKQHVVYSDVIENNSKIKPNYKNEFCDIKKSMQNHKKNIFMEQIRSKEKILE